MPFRGLLRLAVAVLLAAPLPFWALPAAEAQPPFGVGDWVVTGNEALVDSGVILDGNLTVESGGSLTLPGSRSVRGTERRHDASPHQAGPGDEFRLTLCQLRAHGVASGDQRVQP